MPLPQEKLDYIRAAHPDIKPPRSPKAPEPVAEFNPAVELAKLKQLQVKQPQPASNAFLDFFVGAPGRAFEGLKSGADAASASFDAAQDNYDEGKIGKPRMMAEQISALVQAFVLPLGRAIGEVAAPIIDIPKGAVSMIEGRERPGFLETVDKLGEKIGERALEIAPEGTQASLESAGEQLRGLIVKAKEKYDTMPEEDKDTIMNLIRGAEVALDIAGLKVSSEVAPIATRTYRALTDTAVKTFEKRAAKQALEKEVSFIKGLSETKAPTSFAQETSDQLVGNINRILPTKAEEFQRLTGGKSHGQWLNERGINKTPSENIEALSTKFLKDKDLLDEAISEIPGTYTLEVVPVVLQESIDWATKVSDKAGLRTLNGIQKQLETNGALSAKDIIELKRYYERNNKFAYSKELVSTGNIERATNLDSELREGLIDIAEKNGFKEFRELSKEVQQTKFLLNEIAKVQARSGSKDIFDFTDRLLGGASVAEPMLALGIVSKKFLTSDTVKSLLARALNSRELKVTSVDFPKIRQKAMELEAAESAEARLARRERAKAREQAILADELSKQGIELGDNFQFVKQLPLTREEQDLFAAAANQAEARSVARFIIEERQKGNAVGEGFILQNVDNTPLVDPVVPEFPVGASSDIPTPSVDKPSLDSFIQ